MIRYCLIGLLVLLLDIQLSSAANAQADFFKGKQITIVVGFTAGGIIDLWRACLPNISASTYRALRA